MASYAGIHDEESGSKALRLRGPAKIKRRARIDGDSFLQESERLRFGMLQSVSQYMELITDDDFSQVTPTTWTDFNGNLGTFTGNTQNISDEQSTPVTRSDVLTVEVGTGGTTNAFYNNGLFTKTGMYRIRLTYYIPSTNSGLAAFRIAAQTNGDQTFWVQNDATVGAWTTVEYNQWVEADDPIFVLTDSSNSTSGVVANDVMYIAKFSIHRVAALQTAARTKTAITDSPLYEADFSAGVDGWSGDSDHTRTGNVDGVTDDNGASRDNVLQIDLDVAAANQHRQWKVFTPTAGIRYKVEFEVLIPSGNTRVDGFLMGQTTILTDIDHAAYRSTDTGFEATIGEWTSYSFEYTPGSGTNGMYFSLYDGSTDSWATVGGDSDTFYIASFKITPVDNFPTNSFLDISTSDEGLEVFSGNWTATDDNGKTETGCLRMSASNNSGSHYWEWGDILTIHKAYRLIVRILIPSSNTNLDRLDLQNNGGTGSSSIRFARNEFTNTGVWTTKVIDFRATGEDIECYVFKSGSGTWVGSRGDDDNVYIKDFAIYPLQHDEIFYPIGFPEAADYSFVDDQSGLGTITGDEDGIADDTSAATVYNNCYRMEITGGGFHRMRLDGLTAGVEYQFYCIWYLPDANSHCDGLSFQNGNGSFFSINTTNKQGVWRTTQTTFTASHTYFYINPRDGGGGSFTPTTSDNAYIAILEVVPNQPEVYAGASTREFQFGLVNNGADIEDDSTIENGVVVSPALASDESGGVKMGLCFITDTTRQNNPCWVIAPYRTYRYDTDYDQAYIRLIQSGAQVELISASSNFDFERNLNFGIAEDSAFGEFPLVMTLTVNPNTGASTFALHSQDRSLADINSIDMEYTETIFDADMQLAGNTEGSDTYQANWTNSPTVSNIPNPSADGDLNTIAFSWNVTTHEISISKIAGIIAEYS